MTTAAPMCSGCRGRTGNDAFSFPDLSPDKSGRACLPPAGALRPPSQARPDCSLITRLFEVIALRLTPPGKAPGRSPLESDLIGAGDN